MGQILRDLRAIDMSCRTSDPALLFRTVRLCWLYEAPTPEFMMRLVRVQSFVGQNSGHAVPAVAEKNGCRILAGAPVGQRLCDFLHADNPRQTVQQHLQSTNAPLTPWSEVRVLAPLDDQEVWAAGVTYLRSQKARMEESEHGASHYDRVYHADRPELFFKATAHRVSGPGGDLRVRYDSRWSVPEPEFTLVINPRGEIVGYTIGNDMSARDIEGENPLYLPQAKVYQQCCGLGPAVWLPENPLSPAEITIAMQIVRGGSILFAGTTTLSMMKRTPAELVTWLFRENEFPTGAFLLTGTGVVPPDGVSLIPGDVVRITIEPIGVLENTIVQSESPRGLN